MANYWDVVGRGFLEGDYFWGQRSLGLLGGLDADGNAHPSVLITQESILVDVVSGGSGYLRDREGVGGG